MLGHRICHSCGHQFWYTLRYHANLWTCSECQLLGKTPVPKVRSNPALANYIYLGGKKPQKLDPIQDAKDALVELREWMKEHRND